MLKITQTSLILLFVMLVSGCVLPGPGPFDSLTVNTGVIVESFEPDFPEVYSGEDVTFKVKIKNIGSVRAENGFAELLGLDQTWGQADELLPNEPECSHQTKGIVLLPPTEETGGASKICTWNYLTPSVPPGLHFDYKPRVRVYYDYKSHLIKTITVVPKDELKVMQDQGKPLPIETISKTNSPIDLNIETKSPIRTYGTDVVFPIVINVKNTGGGTVCKNSNYCKKYPFTSGSPITGGPIWNEFAITIELPPGLFFQTCGGVGQQIHSETIYLAQGKSQAFTCHIKTRTPDTLTQKNIKLTAEYGYFIDKTTQIRVLPSLGKT